MSEPPSLHKRNCLGSKLLLRKYIVLRWV